MNDHDYLAARVHARRSRLAEAERLDPLCRRATSQEFFAALYPEAQFHTATDFQRRLIENLVDELSDLLEHLSGAGAALLGWMLVKFQLENFKVLLRGIATKTAFEQLQRHLASLPKALQLETDRLARADSLPVFVSLLPKGRLRQSAEQALRTYGPTIRPFFLEGALDRGYFQELLARMKQIPAEECELIQPMICQEVDIFHLMLVVRGRFHYNLERPLLLPLHVPGSAIARARFGTMLGEPDVLSAGSRAVGLVIDRLPQQLPENGGWQERIDAAVLEALAWRRFLRLANRAFRRSHVGLGAIIGYAGIRRVEVSNLITVSEGIRNGMAAQKIRARMVAGANVEAAYV